MGSTSRVPLWVRLGLVAVVAVVALALVLRRDAPSERGSVAASKLAEPEWLRGPSSLPASAKERTALVDAVRDVLSGSAPPPPSGADHLALVSLARPAASALISQGTGESWKEAVEVAAGALLRRVDGNASTTGDLKVDLLVGRSPVERFDRRGRATLDRSLEGLWLPRPSLVLLPEELLARRLVSTSGDLQSGRLRRYLAEGARELRELPGNPGRAGMPYVRLQFQSFATAANGEVVELFRGNSLDATVTPERLLSSAVSGGEYLLRHQHPDGSFRYIYEPKWDDDGKGYNLLRHAGSCYALVELGMATGDERYLDAARRGLENLLEHARGPRPEDASASFRAIVSPGEEAKLGGAALATLALVAYADATGDRDWIETARPLAEFLRFQQDPDGHFRSKYFYGEPDAKPFESVYYPGEAILALSRLHRFDPESGWLEVAERGARWLIEVRDAAVPDDALPHDHWLLMGLEELHELTGADLYRRQSERIAGAIVRAQRVAAEGAARDWVGSFYDPPRSTPTATRAEGLVAAFRLAASTGGRTEEYLRALERMAGFQRRCQLDPLSGMYLPRPDRARGGFRRSLTNWEVRIDYVQHNVSALLGLRGILLAKERAVTGDEEG